MSDEEGKKGRGGKGKRVRGRKKDWQQGTQCSEAIVFTCPLYFQELHNRRAFGWNIIQHIESCTKVIMKEQITVCNIEARLLGKLFST